MELEKLSLITKGKLSLEAGQGLGGDCVSLGYRSSSHFDLVGNLWLVLRLSGTQKHFSFCLRVADAIGAGLMQSVRTGKVQDAYSVTDSLSYASVKSAVLKVSEIVPKAHRQQFRNV